MQAIFKLYGWNVINFEPIHQGLINSTYSIKTDAGEFILQSINHKVFKNPAAIDANINAISTYLQYNHPGYLFTHLVPSQKGNTLVEWESSYFRAFHKLEGYALSVLDNEHQVEEAAQQFAQFTQILKHFDIQLLQDTLPQFHDLNLRYHQFTEAIQKGNAKRIESNKEAIQFLKANNKYVTTYNQFIENKEAYVGDIAEALNISFRNTSKSLSILAKNNLVQSRKNFLRRYYSINTAKFPNDLLNFLKSVEL